MSKKTQQSSKDEEILLTAKELCKRWKAAISSTQVLSNWRNHGKGPAFTKIGGRIVYPLSAIKEYELRNTHSIK